MPFVQRTVEPRLLGRGLGLWDAEGRPRVRDDELEAVTNGTLTNALRQLASLLLIAEDVFGELRQQLADVGVRSKRLKERIVVVEGKVEEYDPKKVTVPESDICTFALLKNHFTAQHSVDGNLFTASTRPRALNELYEAAAKTPVHLMRQLDRWRRDGHRSSRYFLCTPVLGEKRRRFIRSKVDIDIETRMPDSVKDLRRWTSSEALGDVTVAPDCTNRIVPNSTLMSDGDITDGALSDDEPIDHKLPSPEEQLQVIALKFPSEIVAVDISGRSFDRQSVHRRSLLPTTQQDGKVERTRTRRPRNRRRNTLAGTDQKEIRDALTAGVEEQATPATDPIETVTRSKSSDLLRNKKDSPETKKSHFNTLKQWGKNRYDRFMNKNVEKKDDIDDFNIYETVKRKERHERNPSISSASEKSSVLNIAVKLRESAAQRRQRRSGDGKDEPPHSSSGNWSASSESGRASIGSEFTTTTQPKSTTSAATSINSLNQPNSVNSRRKFQINTSTSSSVTSEGTLTPDIIHDLHEDGETSSVYSCDTEGYYTSFHMDSGLKTLKEEEVPCTPLHSTTTVLTAESEYELFGKGSTSTTTSSAGTVCTTLRASDSSKSLNNGCPAVPERKSSLPSDTGTVKRSPAKVVAIVHKEVDGDVSPDSGHNTSSSPIESTTCSPNGVRSGSEFEFSESSDMEGAERIERIRIKTTINSSRIPSMCVITPPHSDDESIKNEEHNNKKIQVINVNPKSGYATIEVIDANENIENKSPILKATLMPLNSMFGKIKTNFVNLTKRDKCEDPGDYVTLSAPKPEYVSLNELPGKRQGARVTLDAEGKVVYSSDSLRRRKISNTTFEPGPFVKMTSSPTQSPLPMHRVPKSIRPAGGSRVVIKATPTAPEIIRLPSRTVVAATVAPTTTTRAPGAYVHLQEAAPEHSEMYYRGEDQYYFQKNSIYQTLPSKKSQFYGDIHPERSVTPDITRGLVKIPESNYKVPYQESDSSLKISPIDPRSSCHFQSSTPTQELKAAVNLESRLLSPKKSTMSNEELYAVIHKSKKKMNIETDGVKKEEKAKSRLSWSPDELKTCNDRKGRNQTSRLDFKKLLLQKSNNILSGGSKKISAVEQLKMSKQQIQKTQPPMNILELSGSPRSLVNRRVLNQPPGSPERAKPKLMSPRSQWRFASPRSDVLSSTIVEDKEDESPNNSMEKKMSLSQRKQVQRAQFFGQESPPQSENKCSLPTLETSF